jgi:outer membrane protein
VKSFLPLYLIFLPFYHFSQTWSLEKCIEYALENNINVKQVSLQKDMAQKQFTQSYLNTFLPNIDASANYNISVGNSVNQFTFSIVQGSLQTITGNLQASMPIFTGLQQIHGIQRSKYEWAASTFDEEDVKNQTALAVTSAFLNVVLSKEMLKVAEKQLQLTLEQEAITAKRVQNGTLTEAALLELQAQKARNRVDIVNAKNQVDLAVIQLKNLLLIPAESNFDLEVPDIKAGELSLDLFPSQSSIFKTALATQPSIKAAEARIKSAHLGVKIARGAFSPSISIFGSIGSNFSDQNKRPTAYDTTYIGGIFPQPVPKDYRLVPFGEQLNQTLRQIAGVTLNIPILSRGQRIINEQISRMQLQSRQLDLENRKNQLQQQVSEAYANALAASESYSANLKSYETAKQSFEAAKLRFENGMVSPFDFERVRINMLIAESQMLQSKYTFVFRKKVLEFYQGKKISLN